MEKTATVQWRDGDGGRFSRSRKFSMSRKFEIAGASLKSTMAQCSLLANELSRPKVDGLKQGRVKPILDLAVSRFNAYFRLVRELEEARGDLENRNIAKQAKSQI